MKSILYLVFFLLIHSCSKSEKYRILNNEDFSATEANLDNSILEIDSINSLGILNFQKRISYYDTLLQIAKDQNLKHVQQNIYRRYGAAYLELGDLNNAVNYYLKSLKISEELKDTFAFWSTKANIGGAYIYFKIYDKAKDYIWPSLAYFKSKNLFTSYSTSAYNLSQIYLEQNRIDSAMFYSKDALGFKLKIQKEFEVYKADSIDYAVNMIRIEEKLDANKARKSFVIYSPWIQNESDSEVKSSSYVYGASLFSKNEPEKAKLYLDSGLHFLNNSFSPDSKSVVYSDLKVYYKNTRQYDSAYKYAELVKEFDDSFYNTEKLKVVSNSNNLYELLSNKEIKLLKSEKQTKNAWLTGLSFGAGFLVFSIIFIYKNQQNKRKKILAETSLNINKILNEVNQTKMEAWADGQEKERSRLAAELHDRLGGLLVMASHHFLGIEKKFDSIKKDNEVAFSDFRKIINNAIIEVRELSKDISSNLVSKLGLSNALMDLKEKIENATELKIEVSIHDAESKAPLTSEIALFRVTQESLNNIMKHAQATEVHLSLTGNEDSLILMIEDNGKGFDETKMLAGSGLGLKSMQKRISDIGGRLNIDSKQGRGTIIVAEVNLTKDMNT